jgi:hypothetical protein
MLDKGASPEFLADMVARLDAVNEKIAGDTTNLGRGYCIGHSFFCSVAEGEQPDWRWFNRIVKTEIEPLLREYYFDAEKQAEELIDRLLS